MYHTQSSMDMFDKDAVPNIMVLDFRRQLARQMAIASNGEFNDR